MKAVIRYSLCVLVASIGWCGFVANILFSMHNLRSISEGYHGLDRFSWGTFVLLLPAFLSAAVAVIAWHFRKENN